MTAFQLFAHRPPTSGIHLLSDPFPERLNGFTSLFAKAETVSLQRVHIAPSRRQPTLSHKKK